MTSASSIQQQFLFLAKLHPQSSAYNVPALYHVTGNLDTGLLEKSLVSIMNRHDILRTSFIMGNEGFQQKVHSFLPLDIKYVALPSGIDRRKLFHFINKEIVEPFSFIHETPLWRTRIFQLDNDECYLLFVMQHSLIDLHSYRIFISELEIHYRSFLANDPEPALPNPEPYSDYCKWESEFLDPNNTDFLGMKDFWCKQLSGINQSLDFPTDFNRPGFLTLEGTAESLQIDPSTHEAIKQFCTENQMTPFLFMQAIWLCLLHRYSGKDSFITGVPFTNRRLEKHKSIMGCFVNMLPIPVRFGEKMPFLDLVRQLRKTMLLAHRNQELTIKSIIAAVNPERSLSQNPLFQNGFTFEPPMQLHLGNTRCEAIKVHHGGAQLDLMMSLWEDGDTLSGFVEYNTRLFSRETIMRLSDNYKALIDSALQTPDSAIDSLEILSRAERQYLLKTINTPRVSISSFPDVCRLVETRVGQAPNATAAADGSRSLSYAELNARANQLARHMLKLDSGGNNLVGILMTRGIDMLVAVLAVLKSGKAYVPIEPTFPPERIAYMVDHAGLHTILTDDAAKGFLKTNVRTVLSMDGLQPELSKENPDNLDIEIQPASTAYVIYTSGSTGLPKGVEIPHQALSNFLQSMAREPGMSDNDVLLAVTTLSFDISILELLLPLVTGGTTVIASREATIDGALLLKAIHDHGITIMQATPMTWRMLIDAGWDGQPPLRVLCGGEAFPPDLLGLLLDRSNDVWNMYGPTETTVWSTCQRITTPDTPILVGQPIANTSVCVLDGFLRPVPIGVSGNLYIGGKGLAKGYLNNPELTGKAFITPPGDIGIAGPIYKTGDIAKFHPNGCLEILGRADHQVKVRGFRIELGEIESHLSKYPLVRECVVVALKREASGPYLVAYYLPVVPGTINGSEIREHLSRMLPGYMIPDLYVELDSMPRTANGKIDRKALPAPDTNRHRITQAYAPPVSEVENELAQIWESVLGITTVGIDDKFFELGGSSLMAMGLLTKLDSKYRHSLSVTSIFQYPTIRSLAAHIQECNQGNLQPAASTAADRITQRNKHLDSLRERRKE